MLARLLLVAVTLLSLPGAPVTADYLPIELTDLVTGSDLIALGSIQAVDDSHFTFLATSVLAGALPKAPLRVKKYADWTGGRRWQRYSTGQQLLLFLEAPDQPVATGRWQLRGLAGEGEMPVEAGLVYPHGLNLRGFRRAIQPLAGGELYGYRFDLDQFQAALRGHLRCHARASGTQHGGCSADQLATYRSTSALHEYLAAATEGEITGLTEKPAAEKAATEVDQHAD